MDDADDIEKLEAFCEASGASAGDVCKVLIRDYLDALAEAVGKLSEDGESDEEDAEEDAEEDEFEDEEGEE